MKATLRSAMAAAVGLIAITAVIPSVAFANDTQKQKNDWRNIGIGAGVIAAHGLIHGNGLETVVGVAGAAYAGNRYEQERKKQDEERRYHRRYDYTNGNRRYYEYGGHQYYVNTDDGSRHFVD